MSLPAKATIALYGNVALERAVCRECGGWSFVSEGLTVCCDEPVGEAAATKFRRMSQPEARRRLPPIEIRRAILTEQCHRCLYCGLVFGVSVQRGVRTVKVRLVWDHLVPYSLTQNNYAHNIVAACSLCNNIKGALVFQTIEEARDYVMRRRFEKGIGRAA